MDGIKDVRSPLARALGGRVAWKRVEAPKGRLAGLPIAVRSLPYERIQTAVRAATAYLTEKCGWKEEHLYTELGEAQLDIEAQVQTLALALVVPPDRGAELSEGTVATLASSADDLRALLEPDEIGFLYRQFVDFQNERSPLTRAKSAEEVEAFIDALGKGTTPLSSLSTCEGDTLLHIALAMAARLRRPTSPPSSPTSPSNAPDAGSPPPSDSKSPPTTIETDSPY